MSKRKTKTEASGGDPVPLLHEISHTKLVGRVVTKSLRKVVSKDVANILENKVGEVTDGMYKRCRFLQYHLLRLLQENKLPDDVDKLWIQHAIATNNEYGGSNNQY